MGREAAVDMVYNGIRGRWEMPEKGEQEERVDTYEELPVHRLLQYDGAIKHLSDLAVQELGLVVGPEASNDDSVLTILASLGYQSTFYVGAKDKYTRGMATNDLINLEKALKRVRQIIAIIEHGGTGLEALSPHERRMLTDPNYHAANTTSPYILVEEEEAGMQVALALIDKEEKKQERLKKLKKERLTDEDEEGQG
jgi:hypothetical protein